MQNDVDIKDTRIVYSALCNESWHGTILKIERCVEFIILSQPNCLCISPFVCHSYIYLCVSISISLTLSHITYVSIYLPPNLPIYVYVYLSHIIYLSIYLPVCIYFSSTYLSIYWCFFLSLYIISLCLTIHLSHTIYIHTLPVDNFWVFHTAYNS